MEVIQKLIKKITAPTSTDKEQARREYILNILLTGSFFLAIVAFSVNVVNSIAFGSLYSGELPVTTFSIVVFILFLIFLSKKGKSKVSAYILIFLLLCLALSVSYRWGADDYQGLLMYSLIIVMAGILVSSRLSFVVMLISGLGTILFAHLEAINFNIPDYEWKFREIRMGGAIVIAITLGVIAVVSWLSNREINKALRRALRSEAALKAQRDKLEIQVEERTAQLKQAQAEKITQLYRFAEFGRLSSGLFHDLTNPLTVVSLNLSKLSYTHKGKELTDAREAIKRAVVGTQKLQVFIEAAKKQIQDKGVTKKFSLVNEVNEVLQLLQHKYEERGIIIELIVDEQITLFANPIKFNQLVTNLVSNAIDSYDGLRRKEKRIEIQLAQKDKKVQIRVEDWGMGIERENISKIFEPLFTTKPFSKGTGMGLAICRDIVEKDFGGKIIVESQKNEGSTFTVSFPIREKAAHEKRVK